jgi:DNA-directed RNA polymerase subunit beta'
LKENVLVGRLIPAGTGYSYHQERAKAKAKAKEKVDTTVSADDAEKALMDALNADLLSGNN